MIYLRAAKRADVVKLDAIGKLRATLIPVPLANDEAIATPGTTSGCLLGGYPAHVRRRRRVGRVVATMFCTQYNETASLHL
jgi:hypothetical protein